jgi:DNA-binding SARP family transcriptional activator
MTGARIAGFRTATDPRPDGHTPRSGTAPGRRALSPDGSDRGADPPTIVVRLLGRFTVTVADQPIDLTPSQSAIVAYLALCRPAVHRFRLAADLWPESPERRAGGNLRSTLSRMPAAIRGAVVNEGSFVSLVGCACDLDLATAAEERLRGGDASAAVDVSDAMIDCLAAELLPGWYEDWVVFAQERHRQVRLHALEQISRDLSVRGQHLRAIETALIAVEADPLRESSNRTLVEAFLHEGNRTEALRHFATYCELLDRELGLVPSPELVALVAPPCGDPGDPAARRQGGGSLRS